MAIIAKSDADITEDDVRFLRDNYTSAGGLLPNAYSGGAFFTPTHVAKFITEAIAGLSGGFTSGSRFLEPSCGSGVFLEHLSEDAEVTALELDETSARVASLLYPKANVIQADAFTHDKRDYYDYVVGNPPFGVSIELDAELIADISDWQTLKIAKGRAKGKSEFAFIELAIRCAKPGGFIALVLPKGIGFNSAGNTLRNYVKETCWHIASVELPKETFAHVGTSISTDIHILRKVTPNARKINIKYANVRGYDTVTQMDGSIYDTHWYEGQMPVFHAIITDIGYDKDGKSTDKYGDGDTQLEELIEAFTDTITRSSYNPVAPNRGEFHAFSISVPANEKWRVDNGLIAYYNVLTLGRGHEITPSGRESFDFTWQDDIVAEWTASAHYAGLA